jgi:hypothetical protein
MNRFFLAWRCFLAVLFYFRLPKELPQEWLDALPAQRPEPAPQPIVAVPKLLAEAPEAPKPPPAQAQMLSILQREGRLIDFLMEEVEGYDDSAIGAAVRDIHRGCKKGLKEHFQIGAIRPEPDEAAVKIEEGYDPSQVRLVGRIQGRPPFHGTLRHHGWRAQRVVLPDLPQSHDPMVIVPAEVELGG